jgi:uncharacterized protein YgiM (DUF1202 family)
MSTSRILGKTLAFPAFLAPSSRAHATERAAHTARRLTRSAGRAAWLFGIVAPLVLALALSWQTPSAMAAPGVPAGGGIGPGKQATVVDTEALNLRSGPGLNCPVLTTIPEGATVTVVSGPTSADGYDWYQVTYNGKTGYVAGKYLAGVSGGSGQPCPPSCGNLTPGGYASVTPPYLNMRCGPSINCSISMSLPQGTIVKLQDGPTSSDGYHWWKVSYRDQTGYVAGEFLTPASGPGAIPQSCTSDCSLVVGNDAQVTSAKLNLRSGPGISCPINTSMPHGATVKVLDGPTQADGYNWYKVSYNGTVGYAAGAYLAPVSGTDGHRCQTNCGGPHVGEDAFVKDTPYLHLRNGAGLRCDILTSMPEGAKVHVMAGPNSVDGYDWYHVTYSDQGGHDWDGYTAGDWLGSAN